MELIRLTLGKWEANYILNDNTWELLTEDGPTPSYITLMLLKDKYQIERRELEAQALWLAMDK